MEREYKTIENTVSLPIALKRLESMIDYKENRTEYNREKTKADLKETLGKEPSLFEQGKDLAESLYKGIPAINDYEIETEYDS